MEWGVGAVILDADGRLLLVERTGPIAPGCWAVPGGKLEPGESLRAAVAREVREETGLLTEVGEVAWVGEATGPDWQFMLVDFFAVVVGGELRPGGDAARAEWVPLPQVAERPLVASMHDLLARLFEGAHYQARPRLG